MQNNVEIEIVAGDALSISCDVLVLKYAQDNYGLDGIVSDILINGGVEPGQIQPEPNGFRVVDSSQYIQGKKVIFIGVVSLYDFGYREIRDFSRRALSALAGCAPDTGRLVITLHGAGYGLDENEAFSAEIAGLVDGIQACDIPVSLEKITVIEKNVGRAQRLGKLLNELLPNGVITPELSGLKSSKEKLRAAGYDSNSKEHVFVAMPFKEEMDDTYHYGIQGAVQAAGFLCERADLSAFTGDVMQWVKDRISSATLVIADLTDSNPNVYLEVGYAWGRNIPVVLLVSDTSSLGFDVRGQRCLKYKRIKDLEEALTKELKILNPKYRN